MKSFALGGLHILAQNATSPRIDNQFAVALASRRPWFFAVFSFRWKMTSLRIFGGDARQSSYVPPGQ